MKLFHTIRRRGAGAALLLLSALLLALLPQIVTFGGFVPALGWAQAQWALYLLSVLLQLALQGLLCGLLGRLWPAVLLSGFPPLLLAIISSYKQRINGSPLLLEDLHLADQMLHIAGYGGARLLPTGPMLLALALLLALFLAALLPGKRLRPSRNLRRVLVPAGLGLGLLSLIFALIAQPVAALEAGCASQEEREALMGTPWAMYSAWSAARADARETLRNNSSLETELEEMQSLLEAPPAAAPAPPEQGETTEEETAPEESPEEAGAALPEETPRPTVTPTVIFLMSESFFDLQRLPGVEFERDPQENFHRLAEAHTSGAFLSSTYCGGTAYVELEVLTGICSALLNEGDTLPAIPAETYSRLPTVSGVLREQDYELIYLHSHTPTLYNRREIYNALGFSQVRFLEDFPKDAEYAGGYISDMALTEEIIRLYEARNTEQPLFLYAVSMENHQPYSDGKYGGKDDWGLSSELLDDVGLASLRAYSVGAGHADAALGALTDYFAAQPEPVLLVFWGDHLPSLGAENDETVYSQLGFSQGTVTTDWEAEELLNMLSTDYLIWSNYEETPEADEAQSCTFLGVKVLERLGMEHEGYLAWLNRAVANQMLLYRPRLFVDAEGGVYREIPDLARHIMRLYGRVVDDMVYGENLLFGGGEGS